MKFDSLPPLKVQADPLLAKRHPLHDNRYIITADAEFETWRSADATGHGDDCCGFVDNKGSIVATMRDVDHQAEYARLFAASPKLLAALEQVLLYAGVGHDKPSDYAKVAADAIALVKGSK